MLTPFEMEVFYDSACPLCMREIHWLRGLDRAKRIHFTDIASESFDASTLGISWSELMDRIHGRLPDGSIVEGVEALHGRRLRPAQELTLQCNFGAPRMSGPVPA
jgi:predicted DCC family thiol-disulfide oxidoreductase YuxK